MSHVADVQMKVKDLDALAAIVTAAGGELKLGQTTHRWFGKFMNDWRSDRAAVNRRDPATFGKCEHAIVMPGVDYDIGVVKRADGDGFDLVYDNWGPGQKLEQVFGVGLTAIKQSYSLEVARRQLSRQGYRTATVTLDNGCKQVRAVC